MSINFVCRSNSFDYAERQLSAMSYRLTESDLTSRWWHHELKPDSVERTTTTEQQQLQLDGVIRARGIIKRLYFEGTATKLSGVP